MAKTEIWGQVQAHGVEEGGPQAHVEGIPLAAEDMAPALDAEE